MYFTFLLQHLQQILILISKDRSSWITGGFVYD